MPRSLTRRSFLGIVTGTTASLAVSARASAQCVDADPNDPVDNGQRCPMCEQSAENHDTTDEGRNCGTGCTDGDPNDLYGFGRNCEEVLSDEDSGENSDLPGQPRRTNCTDSDPSDPVNNGVNCNPNRSNWGSDSDAGANADPWAGNPRAGGCTDNDPSDPVAAGVNCTSTAYRDADAGPNQDLLPCSRNSECNDSDPSDPVGGGQNCRLSNQTGVTDSDSGSHSDPSGDGRGPANR